MTHEKTGRAPIEMALLNYSDHNFEDLSFAILIIKEQWRNTTHAYFSLWSIAGTKLGVNITD